MSDFETHSFHPVAPDQPDFEASVLWFKTQVAMGSPYPALPALRSGGN